MHNQALQPNRDHARRLAGISHHFLSDGPRAAPPPERMHLPVLLAVSAAPRLAPEPGYLLRALSRQLNLPGTAPGQDWDLQIYSATAVPRAELALLVVDADLESTREAFTLIKRLYAQGNRRIAVLYRAGDDLAAARRCYRRLAVGAIRFLRLSLINLGWLPIPGPHFAAALARAAQVVHSQGHVRAPQEAVQ